ncbi:hypothetical protein [Paraburkholderia phenazinium]|nr:hypothetical protein [Paraburkholderia phenazinium]
MRDKGLRRNLQMRASALVAIALLSPAVCKADVDGLPSTDERVIVYRELERQYVRGRENEDDGRGALCKNVVSDGSDGPDFFEIRLPNGKYQQEKNSTTCLLDISTGCQSGMFPVERLEDDGRWAWTKSRIGYLAYLRRLVLTAGIPPDVLKPELDAMENLILTNIARRLARPVRLQTYEIPIGMGAKNDVDFDNGRMANLEREFAGSWNAYVVSLSNAQRSKLSLLEGVPDGCGAGETEYEVMTTPPGGRIRLISDMDAMVCEARKIDPWDFNLCQGWTAVLSKTMGLVGTYRYVVDWPNGQSVRDKVIVDQQRDRRLCIPRSCG